MNYNMTLCSIGLNGLWFDVEMEIFHVTGSFGASFTLWGLCKKICVSGRLEEL